MFKTLNLTFFVSLVCATSIQCSRILAVFPMASPSHYILGDAYLEALANAGHDVTMISPFSRKEPPRNGSYRDIILTGFIEEHKYFMSKFKLFESSSPNLLQQIQNMIYMGSNLVNNTLKHTNVQKLLKSKEKFDVVVVGQLINDAVKAMANHFDAHLIIFSTLGPNFMLNELVGNPSPPSYVPQLLLSFPPHMNFWQRMQNTLFYVTATIAFEIFHHPQQQTIMEQYFPNAPHYRNVIQNASLVLLNSHESLNAAVPQVPCMVNIGGFHIKETKKLPEDLQEFLDGAKDGVVYFSMGSNIKSKHLPVEKRNAFLQAFGDLKQKVLWKWEDEHLPGKPANVKFGKWLPQQDILAHPNVKLFITHGGLLSTIETVHHGVPILAIPMFGDQQMNAYTAEMSGYGLVLPFEDVSRQTLQNFLHEILTNPKYEDSAKIRSKIMHDRQVKPIDTAVYWTEYVIRNNGAKHLRIAGLDLAWYQYFLLDVVAFILVVLFGVFYLLKTVFCRLKRMCFKKKVKTH